MKLSYQVLSRLPLVLVYFTPLIEPTPDFVYYGTMRGFLAKWLFLNNSAVSAQLAEKANLPPAIARVLANRGLHHPEEADVFLYGSLADVPSPFLFSEMNRCLERLSQAIANREKILIFGDYDADGILALVMLYRALSSAGADVDYYIPDRLKEGYGIKEAHLDIIKKRGARLVITVDCGIKANRFVHLANEAGIDVIITDHHQPGEERPEALAIINPVLSSSGYPFRYLAGVGVAFKVIQAFLEKTGRQGLVPHYTKLVAIGTVADVVPLIGENRLLVRHGLKTLSETRNLGLKNLLASCGLNGSRVNEWDIGFRLGPRVNAAGRVESADLAVRLFLTDSAEEAASICGRLNRLNSERQQMEERILNQAITRIQEAGWHRKYRALILGCEDWHRGIIGIVASRLKERYHRPVILFSYENNFAYGSGRSISSFSLIQALQECRDLFEEFGGHPHAAGCVLQRPKMDELKTRFNSLAMTWLTEEDLTPTLIIDSPLRLKEITPSFLDLYSLLPPFGPGNPRPLFLFPQLRVVSPPQFIQERSFKLKVEQDGRVFEAIVWENPGLASEISPGACLNVAASLGFSRFWGEETVVLNIEDLAPAG